MELVGEEKRIQTLFRELRLEDEHVTPRFQIAWNRAQSRSFAPRRTLKLSFVAATALLICALVSLVWLSRRWERSEPNSVVAVVPNSAIDSTPSGGNRRATVVTTSGTDHRSDSNSRLIKLLAHRRAEALAVRRAEIRNAAAISSWQSPTTALMSSPVEQVLTSLPQLNESVNALNSFLPSRSN
jgi:hypothetical protein